MASDPWMRNWNRVDAVRRLCIAPEFTVGEDNIDSRLPTVITNAFKGMLDRLNNDSDFALIADTLRDAVGKVKKKMRKVELEDDHEMPAILWIRLLGDAGAAVHSAAKKRYEQWEKAQCENGATLLFRYVDQTSGKVRGPLRERDGAGRLPGYTSSELLKETKGEPPHWPYCAEWKVKLVRHEAAPKAATVRKQPPPLEKPRPLNVTGDSQEQAVAKSHPRRKRRTIEDLRKKCGTNVVAAVEKYLAVEARSKHSLLEPKGRDKRPYNCDESLDQLRKKMQKKYKTLSLCAKSTLKCALLFFVSCPRGRPGGIKDR
jgi:hypothetical protein